MGRVERLVRGAVEARQAALTIDTHGVVLGIETESSLSPDMSLSRHTATYTGLAFAWPTWQSRQTPPPWYTLSWFWLALRRSTSGS